MRDERFYFPRLLAGDRKVAFLLLLATALGEVVSQVLAAAALKSVLIGASSGPVAAATLCVTAALAATFAWRRGISGERLGQDYVNEMRTVLAHQAIAVSASGGPGRFGTLAIRMNGDLNAIKEWADKGVCGGAAGAIGLLGAFVAAYIAAGPPGLLACGTAAVLVVVTAVVCLPELRFRIAQRRRVKGRLSARVGDLLLGARSSAAFAAEPRVTRSVRKAGDAVLDASWRETSMTGAVLAPVLMAVPVGAAIITMLEHAGYSLTNGIAGWAALLFALSLTALALAMLVAALFQIIEHRIATRRLRELIGQAVRANPAAPIGNTRLPPGPGLALRVGDETLVHAGDCCVRPRSRVGPHMAAITRGASSVFVGSHEASDIYPIDWARRVAVAGPLRPIARGRFRQVIAAKRHAKPDAIGRALRLAGLPDSYQHDNPLLDPWSPEVDESTIARLRLVRALAHQPRVVIVDDPWLTADTGLLHRVSQYCEEKKLSLLILG